MNPATGAGPASAVTTAARGEALDALVQALAPFVTTPVDELHVAALIESRGVTDRQARDRYGHEDVFTLAVAVLPDVARLGEPADATAAERHRTPAWRPLVHGPLYLLPSVAIPAMLAVVDRRQGLIGLVAATVVGWLWGMATSAVAYQWRGREREATAARAVQRMTLAGLVVLLVCAASLCVLGVIGPAVAAAMAVQTAFQLAAGALLFYRLEWVLALAVLPAVGTGVAYLVCGTPRVLVAPTLIAAVVSTGLAFGGGWLATARARRIPDRPGITVRMSLVRTVGLPVTYAAVSAGLMLFTSVHVFNAGWDLALAATPLILGMGAVEWRAERFVEAAVTLLERSRDVQPFRRAVRRALVRELAAVLAILGTLGGLLLAALAAADAMTPEGASLVAAHILLGGVFFLGFVLSRHAQFARWVVAMAVIVTAYVVAAVAPPGSVRLDDLVALFLAATAALVLVLVGAFRASTRHIQLFSW